MSETIERPDAVRVAAALDRRARQAADWVRADLAFFPVRLRVRVLRSVIRRLEGALADAEREVERQSDAPR